MRLMLIKVRAIGRLLFNGKILCNRYSLAEFHAKEYDLSYEYIKPEGLTDEINTYEDYIYSVNDDNTVSIRGYAGVDNEIVIPDTIEEKRVVSIGYEAFRNNQGLTSVELPQGITRIEEAAFEGCSRLRDIKLPESLESIGVGAFAECNSLKEINLPSNITSIKRGAFYCAGLTSITLPAGLTSIEGGTFVGCVGLCSIYVDAGNKVYDSREGCNAVIETASNKLVLGCKATKIPQSITSIEEYAFYFSGLENIDIPSSVKNIGRCAFEHCNMESVKLPYGLTCIENGVFERCFNLKEINIPSSVKRIGDLAFYDCTELSQICIPDSVSAIGDYAFSHCNGLTGVKISSGVEHIGNYAFSDCSNLAGIKLPPSITSIGDKAFSNCDRLTIYCTKDSYAKEYIDNQNNEFNLGTKYMVLNEWKEEPITEESTEEKTTVEDTTTEENTTKPTSDRTTIEEEITKSTSQEQTTKPIIQIPTESSIPEQTTQGTTENGTTQSVTKGETIKSTTGNTTESTTVPSTTKPVEETTKVQSEERTTTERQTEEERTTEKISEPIKKKSQILKVTKSYNKEYGAKTFSLNAKLTKGDGKLKYTVSNKNVATVSSSGKVSIKGTGICTVTVEAAETSTYKKTAQKLTITVKPKRNKISEIKATGGRNLSVKWNKDTRAAGYEIQCSTSKSFSKNKTNIIIVKNNKTISYKIKKLTKGSRYYVRVRAYKDVKVNGKTKRLYGTYSVVKQSPKVIN